MLDKLCSDDDNFADKIISQIYPDELGFDLGTVAGLKFDSSLLM